MSAPLDRREEAGQTGSEYEDADHLHQCHDPKHPIVCIVGRRKPREIDPGPADGKTRKAETEECRGIVAGCEGVRQARRRETEAGREREVEEEFERSGNAMCLARIAPRHGPRVVAETATGWLLRPNTRRPVRSEERRNPPPRCPAPAARRRDLAPARHSFRPRCR